ncbi:MAG: hypothetical protein AB1700_19750 [Bacillota bacterium]
MRAADAVQVIEQAMVTPLETWGDYSPKAIPSCIYDKDEYFFLNHPDPPTERPPQLTAATACEIGGAMTAIIPADMCPDEQALVPLFYHECFHAYQNNRFHFAERFDFFKCLAYYPEFDPHYRAWCAAEAEVLSNPALPARRKAVDMAALARKRHSLMRGREGLLAFEGSSERREGTASYVEQKAAAVLFGRSHETVTPCYGWSRQYTFGAAVCHLLDKTLGSDWQARVEQGATPTQVLCDAFGQEKADLSHLRLEEKLAAERENVERQRAEVMAEVEGLERHGVTRIRLPKGATISRSFSPIRITSLGDGRLVHHDFVLLQLPNGTISVRGDLAIEDHEDGCLYVRRFPIHVQDGKLTYQSETLSLSLAEVEQTAEGEITIG